MFLDAFSFFQIKLKLWQIKPDIQENFFIYHYIFLIFFGEFFITSYSLLMFQSNVDQMIGPVYWKVENIVGKEINSFHENLNKIFNSLPHNLDF